MKFADRFALPFPKSTFGNRFGVHDIVDGKDLYGPQGHRGTDFKCGAGATVPAIANGTVTHVFWSDALGNVAVVRHYLHGDNNDVYSGYCHLSSVSVRVGQDVALGSTIGKSGETGTAAHGPHLHLTMSHQPGGAVGGEVFDPIAYIDTHDAVTPAPAKTPTPQFTNARRGEGLIRIALRSGISFTKIKQLNPDITGPDFVVMFNQRVRIR